MLDQIYRTLLHTRMQFRMRATRERYPEVDYLLFEPDSNDMVMFRYNVMRYSARQIIAEHAYRKTRAYMIETPATEIARAEKPYFPDIDESVLADCIATYQHLGCWTPHVEITPQAFEVTQDVFEHFGTLKQRYAYDQVCVAPPA